MAHKLSINKSGKAEMFSGNGIVPWHGLGEVVQGILTAKEAIKAAGLNWTVELEEMVTKGHQSDVDGFFATVRSDNHYPLGVVKGRYEPINNTEAFSFFDDIVGDGLAKYETAGALDGGRQIWIMAKYDGDLKINGDKHRQWMLLHNDHTGKQSATVQLVTERVVCANTLGVALNGAQNVIKIPHYKNWKDKAEIARKTLGLTEKYFKSFKEALEGMNERSMTKAQMATFTKLMFPSTDSKKDTPGAKAGEAKLEKIRQEVAGLFSDGAGNKGKTRWDALQAVTDWADHSKPVIGQERVQERRFQSAIMGQAAAVKQTAYEYLTNDDLMKTLLSKDFTPNAQSIASDDFQRLIGK